MHTARQPNAARRSFGCRDATLAALATLLPGCPGTVASADATADHGASPEDGEFDIALTDEAPGLDGALDRPERDATEGTVDAVDVVDAIDASDRLDADAPDADARADVPGEAMVCPQDPPSGPPPETRRSCGPGEAPSWHCREVHHCGGTFTMGSRQAWEIRVNVLDDIKGYVYRTFPMRECDLHTAVVRPGYVDAYEVTVARFRVWVNAGMPHPARDAVVFGERRWLTEYNSDMILPDRSTANDEQPGVPVTNAMCTWSPTPGVNDNLPINCVNLWSAVAFCWWERKHLATEAAWEFLARNSGTTDTPFGATIADERGCAYGDVGGVNGLCPRELLPQPVDAFPLGATRNPPDIHGLWGGLREWVHVHHRPYADVLGPDARCGFPAGTTVDGEGDGVALRGSAWLQTREEHARFLHSATRSSGFSGNSANGGGGFSTRSASQGFRCMRWVPEPVR